VRENKKYRNCKRKNKIKIKNQICFKSICGINKESEEKSFIKIFKEKDTK